MAAIRDVKKFDSALPSSPIRANVTPIAAENTTKPRMFIPSTDSKEMFHSSIGAMRKKNTQVILNNHLILYKPSGCFSGADRSVLCVLKHASTKFGGNMLLNIND